MDLVLAGLVVAALAALSIYGLLGLLTLLLYWRHQTETYPAPLLDANQLPLVTVQLPIYNERFVVERLIDAAARLDYPAHLLEIQVIDDSDDDTAALAAARVRYHLARGVDIQHVRRPTREGYKAGALAAALQTARGDFVAIFDADFKPDPDFLLRTVPHFSADEGLGMVQTRWGHLNSADSALTAAQSIALDKHFMMEQTVRHRANLFPKFNGAGGVWRVSCIHDAGGWLDDTVCEDLCLSTRAVLKGWRFRFLNDVVAPAELPATIEAYKSQQARWAKGSTQCLLKYGGAIAADSKQSWLGRAYALLTMSAYATQWLLLLLLLLQIPLLLLNVQLSPLITVFTLIGLGQPLLFIQAQRAAYPDWLGRLRHFPTLLLVAIGTAPSGGRAVLQAFSRERQPFVRTPKGTAVAPAGAAYRLPSDHLLTVELALAFYAAAGLTIALYQRDPGPMLLLASCLLGFGYVSWLQLRTKLGQRVLRHPSSASAPR